MKTSLKLLAVIAAITSASLTCQAQTVISEYFDYTGTGNVTTLNGGSGWNGAWTTATTTQVLNGSSNLTFTNANYGTPVVTNANMATGATTAGMSNARSYASTLVTSEVWVSFLASTATGSNNNSVLRPTSVTTTGLGLQSSAFYAKLGNTDITLSGQPAYLSGDTYLFVMKLETDVSGTNDRMSVWIYNTASTINPATLNASPMGTLTSVSTQWTGLDAITMNVRTNTGSTLSNLDNIRIAYGGTTQQNINAVLAVPEPATWALLAGSLTALVVFRRRRRI